MYVPSPQPSPGHCIRSLSTFPVASSTLYRPSTASSTLRCSCLPFLGLEKVFFLRFLPPPPRRRSTRCSVDSFCML
uniref:UBF9 n=1 Tax=Arundo donax TaxID=35708 RepID=A0A0A9H5G9_ARUDO